MFHTNPYVEHIEELAKELNVSYATAEVLHKLRQDPNHNPQNDQMLAAKLNPCKKPQVN